MNRQSLVSYSSTMRAMTATSKCLASSMIQLSKRSVKLDPSRAQGTCAIFTPCFSHWMRGRSAWMYVLYWKKLRCRNVLRCGILSRNALTAMFMRAGKLSATLESDVDVNFHGGFFRWFKLHLGYTPRWEVQSDSKQVSGIHEQAHLSHPISWIYFTEVNTIFQALPTVNSERPPNSYGIAFHAWLSKAPCLQSLTRLLRTSPINEWFFNTSLPTQSYPPHRYPRPSGSPSPSKAFPRVSYGKPLSGYAPSAPRRRQIHCRLASPNRAPR